MWQPWSAPRDPRTVFLEHDPIPTLELRLDPDAEAAIDAGERPTVKAILVENGNRLPVPVGIKIKGAAGSSRPWGDLPALTVQVAKFDKKHRFHGMAKFHLNNSVQDPTRLHEWIGSRLFRMAGYPAPRVGHARVILNGRDVGLYVLKEGFDEGFLAQAFADPSGTLYEGGFCADIDTDLERDIGKGPDDRRDLKALVAACREPDPKRRRELLPRHLDIGSYATFITLERFLCHWDGYVHNRNNYRLYFDRLGVGVFLPHGMDQLLGDVGFPLAGGADSMATHAVLGFPEWERLQRERVRELEPLLRPSSPVRAGLAGLKQRLDPMARSISAQTAGEIAAGFSQIEELLTQRARFVREFSDAFSGPGRPSPTPRRVVPSDWQPTYATDGVEFAQTKTALGILARVAAEPSTSWRASVRLPRGRYVLRANVSTQGVVTSDDSLGSGVGIRISGAQRTNRAVGSGATRLEFVFAVDEPLRDVVLVLELRNAVGKAWFAKESIVVEPLAEPAVNIPARVRERLRPVPLPGFPPLVPRRDGP